MTPEDGCRAAYGATRGRRLGGADPRQSGRAPLSARTETQAPQAPLNASQPRMNRRNPAAAGIDWASGSRQRLARGAAFAFLIGADGWLDAVEAAPSANGWGAATGPIWNDDAGGAWLG